MTFVISVVSSVISDLSVEQVHAILDAIDTTTLIGLRDKALIQLLYNTGARVQEIADLCTSDLRFESPATVTLTGKGRKTRTIPLWEETVQHIQAYLQARLLEQWKPRQYNRDNRPAATPCGHAD